MQTRKQKLTLKEKKKLSREKKMVSAKGNSNYAKKKKFLFTNGGVGNDYEDQPWK